MPVNYKEYHPKWSLIRRLILKRAGHRCEKCGVKNLIIGYRNANGKFIQTDEFEWQYDIIKFKIVLTISHQDHNRENNRFGNLKALCQRCHLIHDKYSNAYRRKYGKNPNQLKI